MMTNFPSGFGDGVSLRGMPISLTHPGRILWVGNSSTVVPGSRGGSNGNKGTIQSPYSTIAGALAHCIAGIGDLIMVLPGHAEAIADATSLILNVAGVGIIGMGTGASRPTITLGTAATANIPVTAANVSIKNLLFKANFADIVSVFTATGTATPTDFSVENCEFRDTSSILNALTVFSGNATANSCDGLRFVANRIRSKGTTAATTAFKLSSATDRVTINENFYEGAVLNNTAALLAHGANVVTNLQMNSNRVVRPNTDTATGGLLITTSSVTNTGMVSNNYCAHADVAAAILVTAGSIYGMVNNLSIGDADASGFVLPAIGAN